MESATCSTEPSAETLSSSALPTGAAAGDPPVHLATLAAMKRLVAIALIAAAAAAYLKRPVRQPAPTGSWGPAEHEKTTH